MHKLPILVACGAADVCCYLFLHLQLTACKLSPITKVVKCQWFLIAFDSLWRWTPLFCSTRTVLSRFLPQRIEHIRILAFFNQQSLPHEDPFCAPKPLQSKWFVGARLWPCSGASENMDTAAGGWFSWFSLVDLRQQFVAPRISGGPTSWHSPECSRASPRGGWLKSGQWRTSAL